MATIYIGKVISIYDDCDGGRIKVRIPSADRRLKDSDLPYAFPLLPKMFYIKPKVGESVCVICQNDDFPFTQRYYIGPIISQPQFMYEEMSYSSTALLNGGLKEKEEPISNFPKSEGAFPKDDDIAICGRKNSDIILSDNDLRIRCGAHLVNEQDYNDISFNKGAPAYIKLKYYPEPLSSEKEDNETTIEDITNIPLDKTQSTATIVADKINLISPNGEPYINVTNSDEGISDEEMKKIIESAHQLPYGDILVKFLFMFLQMFKSHTHKYANDKPCPDDNSKSFDKEYGLTEKSLKDILLSENIRIN